MILMDRIDMAKIEFAYLDANYRYSGDVLEIFWEYDDDENGSYYVEITALRPDGSIDKSPHFHWCSDDCDVEEISEYAWDEFDRKMKEIIRQMKIDRFIDGDVTSRHIRFEFNDKFGDPRFGTVLRISKNKGRFYIEKIQIDKDGELKIEPESVEEKDDIYDAWKIFCDNALKMISTLEVWTPPRTQIHT